MEDLSPLRVYNESGQEVMWRGQTAAAYRQPLDGVYFNHATQKVLTVWRDKVRHVENSQLHLLQQVSQVVVIKRKSTLRKGTMVTSKHLHISIPYFLLYILL